MVEESETTKPITEDEMQSRGFINVTSGLPLDKLVKDISDILGEVEKESLSQVIITYDLLLLSQKATIYIPKKYFRREGQR
jgi:hypothetical protein